MSEDKATRDKLIESAKKEFLEKGYMKASLRNICKQAGVTTGALYFFFQNKEDLLSAIVDKPIQELLSMMQSHFEMELTTNAEAALQGDPTNDVQAAKSVVHFMYQHYDVLLILLTKSQGSRYENIVDQFVDIGEEHYKQLMESVSKANGAKVPDKYILHWMSHMQVDMFIHLLTHVRDEEKAIRYVEEIIFYMIGGLKSIM